MPLSQTSTSNFILQSKEFRKSTTSRVLESLSESLSRKSIVLVEPLSRKSIVVLVTSFFPPLHVVFEASKE